jgi:hypothetical protein
MDLITKKAKKK